MTITTASLDGVDSTTIADLIITGVRRQATPSVRDVYLDVPGRPGAWHFGEAPGDRELTLGVLIGSSTLAARRSSVRELGRWLWPGVGVDGERELILSDEPDRYELVTLTDALEVDELMETGEGAVTFRTAPYALDVNEDTANLVLSPGGPSDTVTVTPSADLANEVPFVATITPQAAIGGFDLVVNSGTALSYSSNVAGGETVTVDTETLSVLHNGQAALTATSGAFAKLAPGDNIVEVITDDTVDVAVTWRRRYV
ncbi:MAG: distal tail protein Dit [Phycisphaerales bacterium]